MKYQFISEYRPAFPVKKMCLILEVSRGGYYKWEQREPSKRKKENKMLLDKIKGIHKKTKKRYGSPRITQELRKEGLLCGKNRVADLMRKNNIQAKAKKKFKATTNSKHNYPIAPNLLEQQFIAQGPNKVWASDITYIWTREGWLYLAAILDIWSRKIVGWAMGERQTKELVIGALKQAIGRRPVKKGIIHHSDRGSQYASTEYSKMLKKHGFQQSMSKKGDCYDNAIMETFFHTLKTELIYWEHYKTRSEAKKSIFEYIEMFYNRERLHSSLDYNSPEDYEQFNRVA